VLITKLENPPLIFFIVTEHAIQELRAYDRIVQLFEVTIELQDYGPHMSMKWMRLVQSTTKST
jgi:hypothetical protein